MFGDLIIPRWQLTIAVTYYHTSVRTRISPARAKMATRFLLYLSTLGCANAFSSNIFLQNSKNGLNSRSVRHFDGKNYMSLEHEKFRDSRREFLRLLSTGPVIAIFPMRTKAQEPQKVLDTFHDLFSLIVRSFACSPCQAHSCFE